MALIVALMTLLLMSALASALVLATSTESLIAFTFHGGRSALYAAEAAVERTILDLQATADWNDVLAGSARSAFVDGPPRGTRTLADGSMLDLTSVVGRANSGARSWGSAPNWQLYAHGFLRDIAAPGSIASPFYGVVMVDAGVPAGAVAVRGEAFGPRGAHRVVEVMVGRSETAELRLLSWRELR